jgi:hypothetical protein
MSVTAPTELNASAERKEHSPLCSGDLLGAYRAALEKIANLENVNEVRGPLETIGVPDHIIKDGGWVPIHPRTKQGIMVAVKIAKDALNAPNSKLAVNFAAYLVLRFHLFFVKGICPQKITR